MIESHDLLGVIATSGDPIFACTCGEIASGIMGAKWAISYSSITEEVVITPSVNFPNHFHTSNPVKTRFIKFADVPRLT